MNEDILPLKIHGIIISSESDSDFGSKDEFDEEYNSLKPPPYNYELIKHNIIKIPSKIPTVVNVWEERKKLLLQENISEPNQFTMVTKKKKSRKKKKLLTDETQVNVSDTTHNCQNKDVGPKEIIVNSSKKKANKRQLPGNSLAQSSEIIKPSKLPNMENVKVVQKKEFKGNIDAKTCQKDICNYTNTQNYELIKDNIIEIQSKFLNVVNVWEESKKLLLQENINEPNQFTMVTKKKRSRKKKKLITDETHNVSATTHNCQNKDVRPKEIIVNSSKKKANKNSLVLPGNSLAQNSEIVKPSKLPNMENVQVAQKKKYKENIDNKTFQKDICNYTNSSIEEKNENVLKKNRLDSSIFQLGEKELYQIEKKLNHVKQQGLWHVNLSDKMIQKEAERLRKKENKMYKYWLNSVCSLKTEKEKSVESDTENNITVIELNKKLEKSKDTKIENNKNTTGNASINKSDKESKNSSNTGQKQNHISEQEKIKNSPIKKELKNANTINLDLIETKQTISIKLEHLPHPNYNCNTIKHDKEDVFTSDISIPKVAAKNKKKKKKSSSQSCLLNNTDFVADIENVKQNFDVVTEDLLHEKKLNDKMDKLQNETRIYYYEFQGQNFQPFIEFRETYLYKTLDNIFIKTVCDNDSCSKSLELNVQNEDSTKPDSNVIDSMPQTSLNKSVNINYVLLAKIIHLLLLFVVIYIVKLIFNKIKLYVVDNYIHIIIFIFMCFVTTFTFIYRHS